MSIDLRTRQLKAEIHPRISLAEFAVMAAIVALIAVWLAGGAS